MILLGALIPHTATASPPVITSASTASAAENQTAVMTVTATDPDVGTTITFSISGGADSAKFSINSSSGVLTFNTAPNFDIAGDANADNVYVVQVRASDGVLFADQVVNVTVTNVNEAPTITSSSTASVAENTTAVLTVTATDPDASTTFTFSIVGGADAAKFAINSSSGALTFVTAPNFEAPTDSNADNVYVVTVRASDGALTNDQTINVTVTNVADIIPNSTTYTTGSGNHVLGDYNVLVVEVWGGGAGGDDGVPSVSIVRGGAGAASTCATFGMTANGGGQTTGGIVGQGGSSPVTAAAAATASGGNNTNANGSTGGADTGTQTQPPRTSGAGGLCPGGGGAGGTSVTTTTVSQNLAGHPGVAPGGGGSGGAFTATNQESRGYHGGASGAYSKSIFVRGVTAGYPLVGASLAYNVGAGGTASDGNAGAAGAVKFDIQS